MSGRLDLPDKKRDFENVSIEYLGKLYEEIDELTKAKQALEDGVALLMFQVAALRMSGRGPGPAMGTLHHRLRRRKWRV